LLELRRVSGVGCQVLNVIGGLSAMTGEIKDKYDVVGSGKFDHRPKSGADFGGCGICIQHRFDVIALCGQATGEIRCVRYSVL
jgi:hypothetical protein